jgi:hypothetical protein
VMFSVVPEVIKWSTVCSAVRGVRGRGRRRRLFPGDGEEGGWRMRGRRRDPVGLASSYPCVETVGKMDHQVRRTKATEGVVEEGTRAHRWPSISTEYPAAVLQLR